MKTLDEKKHDGLEVDELQFHYKSFTLDVSFSTAKGEFVSIVGPSGCGKTTTLSLIAGLLSPDSGNIDLNGTSLCGLPIWDRDIGIVFQDYALFPHMNTEKNIGYGLRVRGRKSSEISKKIEALLTMVNLSDYESRDIQSLSGGEKQRIALARAVAVDPQLLLLDEPLSALDARLRLSLRKEIRKIQQQLSITTLYVTHDQEEALAISDRIIIMNNGAIEQIGTPFELYNHPETVFCADFFGNSNSIPARLIQKIESKSWTCKPILHKDSGGKVIPDEFLLSDEYMPPPTKAILDDDALIGRLFFRPENCRIALPEETQSVIDKTSNIFHNVKILDSEYNGVGYSLEALWEDQTVRIFGKQHFDSGTVVTFSVPKENCWFINEQSK